MVELDIKADSPHEMMQMLRLLTNPSLDVPVAPEWSQTVKFDPAQLPADDDDEQPTAGATQDAEPGEPKRRTRRTKAEMDAARGAEASASPSTATSSSPTVQSADTSSADGDDVVTDEVVGAVMKAALEKLLDEHHAWAART